MNHALDHVGILVPDVAAASARLERLGFRLTRPASHDADGGRPGSVQRSVMFATGYLEIQELADLDGPHPLAPAARRHFGAHILAFGVADAEAARAAAADAGLPVGPVLRWSRHVAEAGADAIFTFFAAAYGPEDEAFLCWVRHETPDVVRPPAMLDHSNGARRLTGVTIAHEGPADALLARYAAAGGARAGGTTAAFRDGTVRILDRAALPAPVAAALWPAPAHVAIVGLAVADPADFGRRAAAEGLSTARWGDALLVDLRADLGCWLSIGSDDV